MANRKRLIVGFVVLFAGLMLTGCATVQAPPELVTAIADGNLDKVESILEENPKLVNSICSLNELYNNTNRVSKPDMIKRMVALRIEATTPLYNAVWNNDIEMVKLLLKQGANPNTRIKEDFFESSVQNVGETPFLLAVKRGKVEILALLIANGADLNSRDKEGYTALAAVMTHARVVRVDDDFTTPKGYPNAKDTALLLIRNGADIKKANRDAGNTLLYSAVEREGYYEEKGWYEVVEALIEKGVNINTKVKRGMVHTPGFTALHQATMLSHLTNKDYAKIVRLLIKNSAKINIRDSQSDTPLFYAGEAAIAQLLIENGADINIKNNYGETALHYSKNDKDIVKLLISHGADINAKDRNGYTALHFASSNQYPIQNHWEHYFHPTSLRINDRLEITKLLLAKGADVNARNKDGKTALALATDKEIINLLKKHGAVE